MRERDIRNAINEALTATNQFDAVWIWGLPENYGTGASNQKSAAIEPMNTSETDLYDDEPEGAIVYTCNMVITLLYRHEEPQLRDEGAELLLTTAQNAVNGSALMAFNLPDLLPAKTRFTGWTWQPPESAERRIRATFQATYMIDGWNSEDVTE